MICTSYKGVGFTSLQVLDDWPWCEIIKVRPGRLCEPYDDKTGLCSDYPWSILGWWLILLLATSFHTVHSLQPMRKDPLSALHRANKLTKR
jgi:hypothetical protein